MKFLCDRAQLNAAVQVVLGVVDARHVKDILKSIKIEASKGGVQLSGTDLEVGMRYTLAQAEVEEPGGLLLHAEELAGIVRESKDEKLLLTSESGAICIIQGKDSVYRVPGSGVEDFPEIPAFPDGDSVEIEGAVIREMVAKTVFAAAPERMRYALNGVLLVVKQNSQRIEMVATDGRRLSWIQRKASRKAPCDAEVIVPTKAALQLERMVGETESVKLHLAERHIFARTADVELVAQLVDGKFPNFRDVIPKDMDKKVEIAADVLLSGVRRASLLADRQGDTRAVTFHLESGKILLTSSGPDTGDAKVELEAPYSGAEMQIQLNPDFVMDGLKGLGSSTVRLEMKDGATPCLFRQGNDYLYLTMPIT